MPEPGERFSGAVGPTLQSAAAAVPHGSIRFCSVGVVRSNGGMVVWEPDLSRHKTLNHQHVNILEAGISSFSDLLPNPVPRDQRIDGDK